MTQEFVAHKLGTRRPGVTEIACELQMNGLISYTRGLINIRDRVGLEHTACECYGIIKTEFASLAETQTS